MAHTKTKVMLISVLAAAIFLGGVGVAVVKTLGPPLVADQGSVIAASPAMPWPVTFSDGSTAAVVGISAVPTTGTWWAADGSRIAAPQDMPDNNTRIYGSASRNFFLVVRHEGPALRGTSLAVTFRQPIGAVGLTVQDFGPDARVLGYNVAVPNPFAAVDLVLRLARGPWTVEDRYDLRSQPAPGATASTKPLLHVASVGEEDGQVTVRIVRTNVPSPGDGEDEYLVLSSADGQAHLSRGSTANASGTVFRFPVPKSQAVALIHRWRPFETREIRNVSLQPGTKTNVTAVTPAP